jgi:hypothetical protein
MEFITLLNTGLSVSKIAKHLMPKHDKTQIIDPLSTIIRLVINSYKPIGTKICVFENRIILQEPSYIQGSLRTINGDNKEDLHFLLEPIKYGCLKIKKTKQILYLFQKAKLGLVNLKTTYQDYPLISRCIELYIKYIDSYLDDINLEETELSHSILLEKDITDKIYDNFSKLWTDNRLIIIYSILMEIEKHNNQKKISELLNILDNFVLIIEKESRTIIHSLY